MFCKRLLFVRNGIIRKLVSYEVFKNSLLKFERPTPNNLFNVSDSLGAKLFIKLRLGLRT